MATEETTSVNRIGSSTVMITTRRMARRANKTRQQMISRHQPRSSPQATLNEAPITPPKAAALLQLVVISICLVTLLQSAKPADSFPSGAPESACKDLKPGHGVEAQSGASPFELTQDKLQVENAGDQIKVTLSSPSKTNFKGLMVQALNEKGEPEGKFLPGKGLNTLDSCSAVTHSDREAKKTATLVWEAPADLKSKETILFKATVVVKMDEIYMGIKSTLGK